ncbi:MAG: DUF484 family protein [Halothiobacillaceae bacterium]
MSEARHALDENAVAEYLAEHPEFFVGHESLLLGMRLPHTAPGTVSLIERQTALLRERISTLEKALRDLHALAHANERLAACMHQLALALIAAGSPCEVLEAARTRLCTDFNLAGVLIGLEEGHALVTACVEPPQGTAWNSLFALQSPLIPRTNAALQELLATHGLPETASLAAIPLLGEGFRGAMLLIKHEPQGFSPDMGTLFLEQIRDLVCAALARQLNSGLHQGHP